VTEILRALLPPAVAVRATVADDGPEVTSMGSEAAVVEGAVPARRREFITARRCAREALSDLGSPPQPLPADKARMPIWPGGYVGSITHCEGFRAAAVARSSDYRALGIDAEPDEPLPPDVLDLVARPDELGELTGATLTRVLFCAKEAIFKAWFPLARTWLGFHDARVRFNHRTGTFDAEILVPAPVLYGRALQRLSGSWAVGNGLIATAVSIPAHDA
jgi:4'-phosphopantetheinyl transferase EntD